MAQPEMTYRLLADLVLAAHIALVVFVVGGLALVVIGNRRSWHWVNELWFRLMHLAAIATIIAESWLGLNCPLTTLEIWLRTKARTTTYSSGRKTVDHGTAETWIDHRLCANNQCGFSWDVVRNYFSGWSRN